ncbi:DNA polymerase III subunit epsilon [Methylocaldum sp.]|uniref:DNA polymerase III subunit epsilon n=1 Tax=Methylocaldum sp. TaxID=1969727 RepID=UPI002D6FB9B6|nr:DNA polymerase III subunit epsilon [Methylocaldum sp.]HYE34281.1 DNA polymerase III subunit epsilon [Methylocaldum sp.]
MRQVVLDTETTGLDPMEGHRVIEIGCVELINRRLTGNRFHVYLNPERDIDPGAVEVHGLSAEFLADKPRFADVAEDLLAYIKGSELIIHNAPFDIGFLNHELRLLPSRFASVADYCTVLDTLALARKKHPGQRNNLDALCKRYSVDNRHRELHGALLDAEILAEVYLAMTGGQTLLVLEPESTNQSANKSQQKPRSTILVNRPELKIIHCSETELQAHTSRINAIDKASNGKCLWKSQR